MDEFQQDEAELDISDGTFAGDDSPVVMTVSNVIPLHSRSNNYFDNTDPHVRHRAAPRARQSTQSTHSTLLYDLEAALDESLAPVEASNAFDDWQRQLTVLAQAAAPLGVGYRVVLGALIEAVRHRDLADLGHVQRTEVRRAMIVVQGGACPLRAAEMLVARFVGAELLEARPLLTGADHDDESLLAEFERAIAGSETASVSIDRGEPGDSASGR